MPINSIVVTSTSLIILRPKSFHVACKSAPHCLKSGSLMLSKNFGDSTQSDGIHFSNSAPGSSKLSCLVHMVKQRDEFCQTEEANLYSLINSR